MKEEGESIVESVLREGGALVTVEVKTAGHRWVGKKLAPAATLRSNVPADAVVRDHIESIARSFHFEVKP